ncbi:MAG: metal-dependent hydrolase [Candidatus Fluviicola riflensis]|nr:MAG: metal-dependent hydrolase [Candidatus Fluviicola riflensis]OGS78909.1 MAG: metal-dependent hydrolase [Candidatus Fluviicola riflensis]OGS85931.1 MAG: metal-dependent hydrolase [Fluviicola sp. RIFCSPHIGHO2_12_FULL_43_24]OGS86340.1 MAG: metal-dependent hydrolase [Fluviicola sp. RIFCSPHIGHO2_01_FULL_43_53]
MTEMELEKLKFPIGQFDKPTTITHDILEQWIDDISTFPARLTSEVIHLTDEQLDTHYRPDGWTIRQVVHHCADSHMNSLTRLKLTLTEDGPTIKPYFEERWAELADTKNMPIQSSLKMLEGIHERWTVLLKNLTDENYKQVFIHPEHGKTFRIDENIGVYAWHCNHHLAHITETKKRHNWK